jgi:hypothetical protein
MKRKTILLMCVLAAFVSAGIANAEIGLLYERWVVAGTAESMLTESSIPDYTEILSSSQWGIGDNDAVENYRARITGWITPPVTGEYTFWLVTDDNGRLWLGTNEDPAGNVLIARETNYAGANGWALPGDEAVSVPITLQAGKAYWMRAGMQEGASVDHIQVAWGCPEAGIPDHTVITAPYIHAKRPTYAFLPWPADGAFLRNAADATELRWNLPTAISDPNGTQNLVTCDVLWFSGDPNLPGTTSQLLVNHAGGPVESVSLGGLASTEGYYWWRVDCYEPNGLEIIKTEGNVWTFNSARDAAEVFVDLTDGSTQVSEKDSDGAADTYQLSLAYTPSAPVIIDIVEDLTVMMSARINSGNDDSEEHVNEGGTIDITSSDIELGHEGSVSDPQLVGLYFRNLQIPAGVDVTSAYVRFEVDVAFSGELHLLIAGEKNVAPAALSTATRDLSLRVQTDAKAMWNVENFPAVDARHNTVDISPIIEEIVGLPGWTPGGNIVILLGLDTAFTTGTNREVESYEGESGAAPILNVGWNGNPNLIIQPAQVTLDQRDVPVTITVKAVNDTVLETDPHTGTILHRMTTLDPGYSAAGIGNVSVSIIEDECGAWLYDPYDFTRDCVVDIGDLVVMAEQWLICTLPQGIACTEAYK